MATETNRPVERALRQWPWFAASVMSNCAPNGSGLKPSVAIPLHCRRRLLQRQLPRPLTPTPAATHSVVAISSPTTECFSPAPKLNIAPAATNVYWRNAPTPIRLAAPPAQASDRGSQRQLPRHLTPTPAATNSVLAISSPATECFSPAPKLNIAPAATNVYWRNAPTPIRLAAPAAQASDRGSQRQLPRHLTPTPTATHSVLAISSPATECSSPAQN
jgi:hypothetical protein